MDKRFFNETNLIIDMWDYVNNLTKCIKHFRHNVSFTVPKSCQKLVIMTRKCKGNHYKIYWTKY